MSSTLIISISLGYLAILLSIASLVNRSSWWRARFTNNAVVYALSLTVYCTAWTFYGSTGRAADDGLGWLGVYLGPTLVAPLFITVLKKIIRISKHQRITSIADFISARYGKSISLGIIVSLLCLLIVIPYISIQLKAFDFSFRLLRDGLAASQVVEQVPFYREPSLVFVIICAVVTILFGTRRIDASDRHPEIVSVVTVESVIKLMCFLIAGISITFAVYDGPADLFGQAYATIDMAPYTSLGGDGLDYTSWCWIIVLSALAFILLPRQFHMAVVENERVAHLKKATWLTPLYLLAISLFVWPVAFAGKMLLDSHIEADTYLLSIPLSEGMMVIASAVYIGGLAAISGMIIISMLAMSIMIGNNVFLPLLLRFKQQYQFFLSDMDTRLLQLRRVLIMVVMLLSYGFYKGFTINYSLVSVGLISFAGIAQLAPAVFLGIYWKYASGRGAMAGLVVGIVVWMYTLPIANLSGIGLISTTLVTEGPWGVSWLRPTALLGTDGLSTIAHGAFWSLLTNTTVTVVGSLLTTRSTLEIAQTDIFINPEKYYEAPIPQTSVIVREADYGELESVLLAILGKGRGKQLLDTYFASAGITHPPATADSRLIDYVEHQLAGSLGTASANVVLNYLVKRKTADPESLLKLLDQTYQVYQYSQAIATKSAELEATTLELQTANIRLRELDELKNEFIGNVTHELRTPITSIRSLAGILQQYDITEAEKAEFLDIINKESIRISNLVNQVLDLRKIVDQREVTLTPLDVKSLVKEVVTSLAPRKENRIITLHGDSLPVVSDPSRLKQVIINLLSNALKFTNQQTGTIDISWQAEKTTWSIMVIDNGIGIGEADVEKIFDRFYQVKQSTTQQTEGSGLGLAITKELAALMGGTIEVKSKEGEGTKMTVRLPAHA